MTRRAAGRSTARQGDDQLKGCSDVDLGCSPSTNTLPIRRLGLGDRLRRRTIQAAWIRFPALHRREGGPKPTLGSTSSRTATRAGTFEAELTVDDDGLVAAEYAEWRRRTGIAFGPEDTQPLDSIR